MRTREEVREYLSQCKFEKQSWAGREIPVPEILKYIDGKIDFGEWVLNESEAE